MNNLKLTLVSTASALLFSLLVPCPLTAQSTVVNVPSTEVVPAKKVYLEMDFITNYAWQRDETKFANYLPRAVIGLGHNLEAGVNVSYTRVPGGVNRSNYNRTPNGSFTMTKGKEWRPRLVAFGSCR